MNAAAKKCIIIVLILNAACVFAQTAAGFKGTPLALENYFQERNGLNNFYQAVVITKNATVAFLGGSITYNPGWRDKVCVYLKEKFPATEFHFIKAGIPSLGSLPHVFRLQQDVLDSGKIDLLFVEAAVNDRTNGTDSLTQVRDLEGIVRHARQSNPSMDILLMSFAEPVKTTDYNNGRIPAEVANHELIAAHYYLPSVNLAKEVHDKLNNNEFSWERDFKDLHPSPFGQELYFQAIKKLLDTCYVSAIHTGFRKNKNTVLALLDKASFTNGRYVAAGNATHDNDWQLINDWVPSDGTGTRNGFVHVPVLQSIKPNAALTFPLKGDAVGIAVVSGPDAGIISYAVDNGAYKSIDLYTQWSKSLHLPWYLLLASKLKETEHVLHIKISPEKNPASKGNACRIVHFLVNE